MVALLADGLVVTLADGWADSRGAALVAWLVDQLVGNWAVSWAVRWVFSKVDQ